MPLQSIDFPLLEAGLPSWLWQLLAVVLDSSVSPDPGPAQPPHINPKGGFLPSFFCLLCYRSDDLHALVAVAAADTMAPITTAIPPAIKEFHAILDPAIKGLNIVLRRIGFENCPGYDDEIDMPGENGPGGGIGEGSPVEGPTGAQRNGILLVIMMFGVLAVMFTIIVGWIWCVAAHEPTYYSVREGRGGSWKTKRVIPFKEWYRRHRNLPRTKSDFSREEDYHRVLAFLSARNWRGRVLSNGEPDYDHTHWKRSKDTQFWRENGHNGAFSPRSPLMSERGEGEGGYNTFFKEGAGIEIHRVGVKDTNERPLTSVPFLPLTMRVPPLRRPPLKGRIASLSNSSTSPENGERKLYKEQRGCGRGGGRGRPWKCGRRDEGDSTDNLARRLSCGGIRGSIRNSRGCRSSAGIRPRGLDVVVEEAPPAAATSK